jgi:hypothetical protein
VHHLARRQTGIGLSEEQLRDRLTKLQELHILPEYRAHTGLQSSDGLGDSLA